MGAGSTLIADTAAAAVPSVVISEVFGPTVQGEGPSIGVRAAFVRLGGCNLSCTWCDSAYTWDASRYDLRQELTRVPVADIIARVRQMHPAMVVVTGGEPLLWQNTPGWDPLIGGLTSCGRVEIETNGTIAPGRDYRIARYVVSPKLAHSGDPAHRRIVPGALDAFANLARQGRAVLKIVVCTPADVHAAAGLATGYGWRPQDVYVMPEGTDTATLLRRHAEIADAVTATGVSVTTRLHILTWGNERGR